MADIKIGKKMTLAELMAGMKKESKNPEIDSLLRSFSSFFDKFEATKTVIKGDKGDTPTKDELLALIKPLIPEPIKGDNGLDGRTPIYIGNLPPEKPQKGDIWYQD